MSSNGNFYKLILVDDEDEVRGRISSKISEESGFQVVGTAGNGHDALELIDECSPHVVITDIRMPYVDGIELAGIIKREYPTIRVAFITGYDEFDYAREAVELGVRSYLTKPLTQGDISKFLTSLKQELDEEFRQISNRENLQARYEDSLPLIIDNYFASFLSNSAAGGESEIQSLADHGIGLDGVSVLVLAHVERDEDNPDVFKREKRKFSIRGSFKDIFGRRSIEFRHFIYQDSIVFILAKRGDEFSRNLDEALLEAVQTAKLYHAARIDIGVSGDFIGFAELREGYLEARRALADSQFLNTGGIAYFDELEKMTPKSIVMSESDLKDLEYAVKFGSEDEVRSAISVERKKIEPFGDAPADFRLYILNLLNIAVAFASTIGVDITALNGGDVIDTVGRFGGLEQALDWFGVIIAKLRSENLRVKRNNSELLLENAVAYIEKNFQNPALNLEKTCDVVGVSVSYLSLLFKKYKNQTFVKYLTSRRLDKAKELLKYSGDRVIEIAEKCGYKDVYYFSHSFKKSIGQSPKQYREDQNPN